MDAPPRVARQHAARGAGRRRLYGGDLTGTRGAPRHFSHGVLRGLRGALYGGSLPFRNCSPSGAGWINGGKDGKQPLREAERPNAGAERCVGPFAFAKGPFAMLSTSAIRWLVASAAFERDVSLAAAIVMGHDPWAGS